MSRSNHEPVGFDDPDLTEDLREIETLWRKRRSRKCQRKIWHLLHDILFHSRELEKKVQLQGQEIEQLKQLLAQVVPAGQTPPPPDSGRPKRKTLFPMY